MKRPIYHAIVRRSYGPVRIIAVTKEKFAQWYGRTDEGEATHGPLSHILSRHETREEAEGRFSVMVSIATQYHAVSERLSEAHSRLHRTHEEAIRSAAAGVTLPTLEIVWSDRERTPTEARAARLIRSLMGQIGVSDHIVFPEGERPISSRALLAELEP